jgi:GNAT superfamily N-acetyltransferase
MLLMLVPLIRASGEWAVFEAALTCAGLPTEDLDGVDQHFFALDGGVAFGGYFVAGQDALLRSVVVPDHSRRLGLGQAVVTALMHQLEEQGVERAWLLTTTAAHFFERLGFASSERRSAPAAIATTPQFQGVCPSSATFMCRPSAASISNQEASA